MISREQLETLSKWTGFIGIMTIIFGVLQAIGGLFFFIIGALPGVISIILGVKLRNTKKYADEVLALNSDNVESQVYQIFQNLNSYFKIQGILLILWIILSVLAVLGGLAGLAGLSSVMTNY